MPAPSPELVSSECIITDQAYLESIEAIGDEGEDMLLICATPPALHLPLRHAG